MNTHEYLSVRGCWKVLVPAHFPKSEQTTELGSEEISSQSDWELFITLSEYTNLTFISKLNHSNSKKFNIIKLPKLIIYCKF